MKKTLIASSLVLVIFLSSIGGNNDAELKKCIKVCSDLYENCYKTCDILDDACWDACLSIYVACLSQCPLYRVGWQIT